MNRSDINWAGNFTAVVTPFTKQGAVDEAAFRRLVDLLIREGIDGIVATGCTGEFWALSDEERIHVHKLAVDVAAGRVPVIAGTMDMITDRVISLSKRANSVGVDGIMVTPPYYILPNEEEILLHFRRISDEVDTPILVYNIPKRVGVSASPALLTKLSDIDHVVAVKQSSGTFEDVTETVRLCGNKIRVFAGHSVTRGFPCVAMGVDGFVSSVEPQVMGRDAIRLFEVSRSGELSAARELQYRLIQLDHAVHGIGTFPAALKAAMNLVGRPGGYPRSPILPLAKKDEDTLRAILKAIGLS